MAYLRPRIAPSMTSGRKGDGETSPEAIMLLSINRMIRNVRKKGGWIKYNPL
jgi:hypothetical protein